uniref:Laminin G domain-containing protein n=1 Tax=Eptatretus burgeri TaxID=7764 RepID=A0A8C4QTM2_EPTBU
MRFLEANDVVNKAKEKIDESLQSVTDGRKLGDLVYNATTNMKGLVEGLVKQRLDKKVEEVVERAWNHAITLSRTVDSLISTLNRLKNQSHNVTDFQNISDIIQLIAAVNKTATEAQDFASQALNNALGPNGTLREIVAHEKDRNVMQHNKLDDLKEEASETRNQLHNETSHVYIMERQLEAQQQLFQQIVEELNRIHNDGMKYIERALEDASRINMSASDSLNEAAAFNETLSNMAKGIQNLEDANKKNLESINDASKNVTQLNETLFKAQSQVSLLSRIQRSLKDLNEQAKHNLSEIKELIKLSRELVNRVQIGINVSKESCLRTYMPPLNLGKHNHNNLTFQLNPQQLNNSIFFIGQDAKSDYMAVEMHNGIVYFAWNLGSGDSQVQYPRLRLKKDTWYLVTISREMNKGSLTVQSIDDLEPPSSKAETRYSPLMAIALDITNLSRMFIGGINKSMQLPKTLQYFTFDGSIRNVMLNGDYFSVWNFNHMKGLCNGTAVSKQAGSQEEVHFKGDGSFVEVIPRENDMEVHDISFDISTYVPNGLLMYVAEEKLGRFVSLQLDNGTITVMYTDKNGIVHRLTSKFNYMKKGFLKIKLLILQKDIKLIVDEQVTNEVYDGAFKPSKKWYFGGLPKHIIINVRAEVQHHSYAGCMRGIKILDGQKPRLLQSLNAVGIQNGCQLEKAYRAEVEPGGFVELPKNGMFLRVNTNISFTFSTKSSSALLLYGGNKPQAGSDFFLIYLKNHIVEVRIVINGENAELSQQLDTGPFNNAGSHVILLSRNNQKVELSVDEAVPVKGDLSTNQSPDVSHILVGGSFSASDVPVTLNRKDSLCITGLIINNVLINIMGFTVSSKANIGFCPKVADISTNFTMATHGEVIEKAAPAKAMQIPCASDVVPTPVNNALSFGLFPNSCAVFTVNHHLIKKSLTIGLKFRTFARAGLLMYLGGHFELALLIQDGHLLLAFDFEKKMPHVQHPNVVSDGRWHTVIVKRSNHRIMLRVDHKDEKSVSAVAIEYIQRVDEKLYVGGLPKVIDKLENTHSLAGCVGHLHFNGKPLQMDFASKHNTGPCYKKSTRGLYFYGDGFAELGHSYRVGRDLGFELKFRTTRSDGVILGIGSVLENFLGVELVDGQIVFQVDNGGRSFSVTHTPVESGGLCDGRWHRLKGRKVKNRLLLWVDGKVSENLSKHPLRSANTKNHIYLGGYPGKYLDI